MRHGDVYRRLGRNTAHRRTLFQNLVTSLVRHERIETTLPKASELQRFAERLISKAKRNTQVTRLRIQSFLKKEEILTKLFDDIVPRYRTRRGGYTRLFRIGPRHGDKAPMGLIELVDSPFELKKALKDFVVETAFRRYWTGLMAAHPKASSLSASQKEDIIRKKLQKVLGKKSLVNVEWMDESREQSSNHVSSLVALPNATPPSLTTLNNKLQQLRTPFPFQLKALKRERCQYVKNRIEERLTRDLLVKYQSGI